MKIIQPVLYTHMGKFNEYIQLWNNFILEYNYKCKDSYQLKAPHRECYFLLIHLAKQALKNDSQVFDDGVVTISTNRELLSRRLHRSGHTVHRYLMRLEKAGVIKKTYYGTRSNFDIHIQADFLLVYDSNKPEYSPRSRYVTLDGLRAKCTLVPVTGTKENKIIPVDDVKKPELHQNTTKHEDRMRLPAKEQRVAAYSNIFYSYMVAKLFSNHNIYPVEKERAVEYIKENYFNQIQSNADGDKVLANLKWRVNAAKSYICRNNFDFSNMFPRRYLDVHNKKGFSATNEWLKKARKYHLKKESQRARNKVKLLAKEYVRFAIAQFLQTPKLECFRYYEGQILSNYPLLIQDFYQKVREVSYA